MACSLRGSFGISANLTFPRVGAFRSAVAGRRRAGLLRFPALVPVPEPADDQAADDKGLQDQLRGVGLLLPPELILELVDVLDRDGRRRRRRELGGLPRGGGVGAGGEAQDGRTLGSLTHLNARPCPSGAADAPACEKDGAAGANRVIDQPEAKIVERLATWRWILNLRRARVWSQAGNPAGSVVAEAQRSVAATRRVDRGRDPPSEAPLIARERGPEAASAKRAELFRASDRRRRSSPRSEAVDHDGDPVGHGRRDRGAHQAAAAAGRRGVQPLARPRQA